MAQTKDRYDNEEKARSPIGSNSPVQKYALLVLLDQVDYTNNACGVTEMVGAVLPVSVIQLARAALTETAKET